MLVLNRKSMEQIQIGDNVLLTVLEIRGNRVRIGISAPREIRVLRSELKGVIPELPPDLVADVGGLGTEKVLPNVIHS